MATRLTPDQLRKEPAFISLPERFQRLVVEYLKAEAAGEANPKAVAIEHVYRTTSRQSSRVMAVQYFSKAAIAEVLALAAGLSPREAFIAELRRLSLRRTSTPTQLSALRLYGTLMGWIEPANSVKKSAVKVKDEPKLEAEPAAAPKLSGVWEQTSLNVKF